MGEPDLKAATPADAPRARPRYTLERKLASWTIVMATVPTLICAVWLNMVTRRAMVRNQSHGVALLADTAAKNLSGHVGLKLVEGVRDTIDTLVRDRRLAFFMVVDPDFKPIYLSVADNETWDAYRHWKERNQSTSLASINRPIELTQGGDVIAWKTPIWNPPASSHTAAVNRADGHKLEGFVVLAKRDDTIAGTVTQLQAAELTAASLLCLLSIPVVVFAVRRWTAPLRALMEATDHLARGGTPRVVETTSHDDDLGMLAESFNQMSRKLKASYAALEDANAGLERKVEERTAELERAKRDLEHEISDKNEFLRAVSHDLGAPLRNIGGMAAMLLVKYKSALAEDAVNKLERIGANVKAQTDLISDLLELSRIRTRPGKKQELDLHTLVQELVETLAYDLDKGAITLDIRGRLPVVVADRNRLRQVFQNLLDNAIKYMLDAPMRYITVECADEQQFWHVTVRDTGRGISERDLPNVFQLYKRGTHSGTHHVPGRGVGLSGVKTIVETYGGCIWVESELGKGSAFHFTLDKRLVEAKQTNTRITTAAV